MESEGTILSTETKRDVLLSISYTARRMAAEGRFTKEQAEAVIIKTKIELGLDSGNGKVETE